MKELQSFLGTVNYLSRFLPFLSDPLQNLLKKDSEFIWTNVHQHMFDHLKLHVSNDVKLNFYDSSKPFYIEVDTSKKGVGAVMLQEDCIVKNTSKSDIPNNLHPISYASKMLSSTECNYSNIERELLGVLFAITHFKHFTYGCAVYVITDHKPLVSLFKMSLVDASPCLTHMLMQLLDYTLNVHYQPGERMHLNDALSCLSSQNMAAGKTIKNLDVSIHAIEELTGFNSISVEKLRQHTASDPDPRLLIGHINNGFSDTSSKCPECLWPYFSLRDELSTCNGLVFKGNNRVVLPASLR